MHADFLANAKTVLLKKGLLAYPTEAVYGLGCVPDAVDSVKRILRLKQRPISQGMILVAADFSQLESFINLPQCQRIDEVMDTWPGPVTWIMPASEHAPVGIKAENNTVAVRVSADQSVVALCELVGALVSTSANPKGEEPARSSQQVEQYFSNQLDYIIPGNISNSASVSEIRDSETGEIIRPMQNSSQSA